MANTIITTPQLMAEVIRKLDKKASIFPLANRAYEGELRRMWQIITVQEYPSFEMELWTTLWEDITSSDWAIADHNLTIDQSAKKNLKIKDIELIRSNLSLENGLAARIAQSIRVVNDQFTAVTAVKWVNDTNKIKDLAPWTLVKTDVVDEVNAIAQKLEEANVDVDAWNVYLFINPAVRALINNSDLNIWFDKWLNARLKGFAWMLAWMNVISTNNLPYKQKITLDGLPTDADTITINWVVFTFQTAWSAAAAWDISIWADAAATQANLIAAVNWTWTPSATTYIDVSAADRQLLRQAYVNLWAFTSDIWAFTAWRYIVISESADNLALWTASRVMFAMETNAVNVPFQMIGMKTTDWEKSFSKNLLWENAWGWAVLWSNDKRIATYDITNWTTVA